MKQKKTNKTRRVKENEQLFSLAPLFKKTRKKIGKVMSFEDKVRDFIRNINIDKL